METDSRVLHIPLENAFDVSRLSEIMELLSEGKFILHNNEVVDL